jgi:hypothetical protein
VVAEHPTLNNERTATINLMAKPRERRFLLRPMHGDRVKCSKYWTVDMTCRDEAGQVSAADPDRCDVLDDVHVSGFTGYVVAQDVFAQHSGSRVQARRACV